MQGDTMRQLFDFLLPEIPADMDQQGGLADMVRAEYWRSARALLDGICEQVDRAHGERDDGYNTFLLERNGSQMLLGIRCNPNGTLNLWHQAVCEPGPPSNNPIHSTHKKREERQ